MIRNHWRRSTSSSDGHHPTCSPPGQFEKREVNSRKEWRIAQALAEARSTHLKPVIPLLMEFTLLPWSSSQDISRRWWKSAHGRSERHLTKLWCSLPQSCVWCKNLLNRMDNAEQCFTKNVCSVENFYFMGCNLACRSSYDLSGEGRSNGAVAGYVICSKL